jgi:hypothetical protein
VLSHAHARLRGMRMAGRGDIRGAETVRVMEDAILQSIIRIRVQLNLNCLYVYMYNGWRGGRDKVVGRSPEIILYAHMAPAIPNAPITAHWLPRLGKCG